MRAFLLTSLVSLSYQNPSGSSVGSSNGYSGTGALSGPDPIGLLVSDIANSKGDSLVDGGFCGFVPSSFGKPYVLYKSGYKLWGDKSLRTADFGCVDKLEILEDEIFFLFPEKNGRFRLKIKARQQETTYKTINNGTISDFTVHKGIVYVSTFNTTSSGKSTSTVWKLGSTEPVLSVEGIVHRFEIGESGNEFYLCRHDHTQTLNLLKKQVGATTESEIKLKGNACVLAKGNAGTLFVGNESILVLKFDANLNKLKQYRFNGQVQKIFFSEKTPSVLYTAVKKRITKHASGSDFQIADVNPQW